MALFSYLGIDLSVLPLVDFYCSSSQQDKSVSVTREDVEHLCKLVEVKDGGPAWIQMMDRSTPTMAYQAWRRDPEVISSFQDVSL